MAPSTTPAFMSSLGSSVFTTTAASTAPRVCLTSNFTGLRLGAKPIKSARFGAASVSAVTTDVSLYQNPVDVPINGTVTTPASNAPEITEASSLLLTREYEAENGNYHMKASNAGTPEAGKITFNGETYYLEQFHVHNRSEHHLAGRDFPIELHLVHTREKNDDSDMKPTICVLGLFVDNGPFNSEFDKVLDAMEEEHKEVSVNVKNMCGAGIQKGQLVSMIGSTTTDPFTRNVQWIISQEVIKIGWDQVQRYQKVEGVRVPNNRDIQKAYDREMIRYYN